MFYAGVEGVEFQSLVQPLARVPGFARQSLIAGASSRYRPGRQNKHDAAWFAHDAPVKVILPPLASKIREE